MENELHGIESSRRKRNNIAHIKQGGVAPPKIKNICTVAVWRRAPSCTITVVTDQLQAAVLC
jgi:hypothetical protein